MRIIMYTHLLLISTVQFSRAKEIFEIQHLLEQSISIQKVRVRKINRAVKIRIYPNKEQITQIEKTIGCSRFLYNRMLADKIRYYQEEKKMLKNTPAGYKKEYPWLKEVDSLALANVQLNLEGAFRKFFREPGVGFPHYKSKKHSRKSYTTNMVNGNICSLFGQILIFTARFIFLTLTLYILMDCFNRCYISKISFFSLTSYRPASFCSNL